MTNVAMKGLLIECRKQTVFVPWRNVRRGKYVFPSGEMNVVFAQCPGCGEVHQVNELLWGEDLPVWVAAGVKGLLESAEEEGD